MAYIAYSNSPIHVRETAGDVDPGWGNEPPVDPGYGRPGGGGPTDPGFGNRPPTDPGYGRPDIGPIDPGFGNNLPPITTLPIPPRPGRPDNGLPPTYPVRPDNSLPRPPHMWPHPPRPENPDPGYDRPIPIYPSVPIYEIPPEVDNTLPMEPGTVWPPLPDEVTGKVVAFVWFVGIGWRWGVFDADLKPTAPIAPPPLYIDNELPPTPEPK